MSGAGETAPERPAAVPGAAPRGSPALAAYLGVSAVAGPAVARLLARRARRGKEDSARLGERLGHAGVPRPEGRLLWLHGASVGEAVSLLPLLDALAVAAPDARFLVTSGTVTAAARLSGALPGRAVHQYAPVDTRGAVRRFLDHWRPDLAIRVESEIWPRLIVETAARGIPLALVNARLSERSARGWSRLPRMARALIGRFALVVTQDGETARRMAALGADPARLVEGANLKSAVRVVEPPAERLAEVRAAVAGRPVWLAASTHEGEEAIVAAAQARIGPPALLILAPRHPDRGDAVAAILAAEGLDVARRMRGERPGPGTDVWLADTLGEMGLWYRVADLAFVGGSLAPRGGHTPFEPAALGLPVLHGPDTTNFAPAYAAFAAAGAAREVRGAEDLAAAVSGLLADPVARAEMARAGQGVRTRLAPDLAGLARRLLALCPAGGGT